MTWPSRFSLRTLVLLPLLVTCVYAVIRVREPWVGAGKFKAVRSLSNASIFETDCTD